jgi:tetratricopeptide (TPR) repeat protein
VLGDFALLRELGRGGMGIVYEAQQVSLDRPVALKVLPHHLGIDAVSISRFEREAQAAGRLTHPNIVPVYAIGKAAGHHYYAMQLLDGEPLSQVLGRLRRGATDPLVGEAWLRAADEGQTSSPGRSDSSGSGRAWFDAVSRHVAAVADALQYAHDQGIVHRDVKPSNLMLKRSGDLCLTDFGLARVGQEPGLTLSGALLGTPAYMSPEQIAAGRATVDHRTDVYSLGAVLYEMLTLERPFQGESREEIMGAILAKEPRPPRRLNRRIPIDLETICLKAIEKDPAQRYATAGAMADDLRRCLGRELIAARRTSLPRRVAKGIRRHPVAATALIAVALLAGALGIAWSFKRGQDRAAAWMAVSQAALDLREGLYREGLVAAEQGLRIAPNLDALQLLRATHLLKLMRTREAVEQAEQLLVGNPNDWRAHLILASTAGSRLSGLHSPEIDPSKHMAIVEAHAPETADVYFLRALMAKTVAEQLQLLDKALELDPSHTEALLERINRHHAVKDFPAALADCDRLLAVRPRSTQGRRMRAWTYYYQRDLERAREEIDRAIQTDPDDAPNYWMRAILHEDASRLKEAVADLDRAIALEPSTARFLEQRSDVLLQLGETDRAVADARRAVEVDPDDRESHELRLRALWKAGRKDDARAEATTLRTAALAWKDETEQRRALGITAYYAHLLGDQATAYADVERVIAAAPAEWFGYRTRAALHRRDHDDVGVRDDCERAASCPLELPGDFLTRGIWLNEVCRLTDAAKDDMTRAIASAPTWADPYRWRGVIETGEQSYDAALADLDRAIELAPKWPDSFYNRGRVHAAMERFEPALADLQAYLASGADGMNVRFEQAKALSRLGRLDEALAAIDAAVELQPKEELNERRRGFMYLWAGRTKDALAAFSRAVEMDPSSARALQTRAYGAAYAGEPCATVAADLDRARRMDPEDEWVAREVAWIHAAVFATDCPALFRPDQAIALCRRLVKDDPKTAEFHETLGLALYRRGDYAQAKAELEEALRLYPQPSASTLFSLAMTKHRLGQDAEAYADYGRAVARMRATYPDDPRLVRAEREARESRTALGID